MSKNQILILIVLLVLVLGIFAVFAYLAFFQGDNGADVVPTATPTPAVVETATPAQAVTQAQDAPAAPTATPSPHVAVVVTGDAKSVAQATVEVTAQQTVEAKAKLDAAMQQMPAGEADLSAEDNALKLTMKRIGWLRIGQIWLKVQFTNKTHEYLTVDPGYLRVIGQDGEEYAVEDAADLPGALIAVAIEAGDSVTGDISFRLPLDVPPAALVYDDGEREPLTLDILNWIVSQPASTSQ